MTPSVDQVLALAPDEQVRSAGRKLSARSHWKSLGRSAAAAWGECQGSALYQVRVDLASLASKCSCPSRKFPCKHGMGLLLLLAGNAAALPEGAAPDWVAEWLGKRVERQAAKQEKAAQAGAEAVADPAAQEKRAQQRARRVDDGLRQLELWASDLVRRGIASVEAEGSALWEKQAERMVDAQAPGLASRLRRLGDLPGGDPDWPRQVLEELGKLALVIHAHRRIDRLPAALQSDVRQAIGFNEKLEDVARDGESVSDAWCVVAQVVDDSDRVRVQRTWLVGERTRRHALLLQFAPGKAAFASPAMPGTRLDADLAFFPSAFPLRAVIKDRKAAVSPLETLPGHAGIDDFLDAHAEALARQPWLDRLACVLDGVVPDCDATGERWHVVDRRGCALAIRTGRTTRPWKLLALSGGHPVSLAGEWDGRALLPLGLVADGAYHVVRGIAS